MEILLIGKGILDKDYQKISIFSHGFYIQKRPSGTYTVTYPDIFLGIPLLAGDLKAEAQKDIIVNFEE